MPRIQVFQSHDVTPDEARRRLEALNADLRERYGLVPVWKSPTEVEMTRSGASGTLRIEPREIRVDIELPFALSMLRGRIEDQVRRELSSLFAG